MRLDQLLGIMAGVLIVAFIIFAFRQGRKLKPGDGGNRDPTMIGPGDMSGT